MKRNPVKRTQKLLGEMQYALTQIEKESLRHKHKDSKERQERTAILVAATLTPLYKRLGLQLLGYRARSKGITD